MKVCHFLKCSFIIALVFSVILGFASSNSIEKTTKSSDKTTLKSTVSSAKTHSEKARTEVNLNKKLTSLKPKEEAKKASNNKKEEKAKKHQEADKHKENNLPKSHPERVNSNASANTENKGKTIATETATNSANAENKMKEKKTSALDFFSKTSKSNQSAAGKAFAAFIGGFILFYLSILLICRNERSNVVETKFIDWINEDVKHVDLNSSSGEKDLVEKKPILIEGNMKFYERPVIEGLDLDSQNKNIVRMEILVEEFKRSTYTNQEGEEKTTTMWISKNHFDYNGKLLLDKNIVIDLKNNHYGFHGFETHFQKEGFEGNVDNLKSFMRSKCYVQNNFFKKYSNSADDYFYFLKNDNGDFNDYEDGDIRASVKFYYLEGEKPCLIAGELRSCKDLWYLESSESPVKEVSQGWFFCCFDYGSTPKTLCALCPSTNKSQFIQGLRSCNECWTSFCRVFSFLIHFASYYLILYPFILILGMIPFIGAITSFVLILFAFIMAVLSYLFILIVSWIFARPLFAFLLLSVWIAFVFIGKITKDKFGNDGNKSESDPNNGYNNTYVGKRIEQTFLAAH